MRLNWESITHLFQIPLGWFRRVDRLIHIIGDGHYIQVDQKGEDGTVISIDPDSLTGGYSGAANSLIQSDDNGELVALLALPSSNVTEDKVLTVLKGGKDVTWEDAAAQNHSSPKDLTVIGEGTAAANIGTNNQWTCDGTRGVKFTVQTRTYYDHTASTPVLYGYYRTFTFDRNGRLYSVSVETQYEIDKPVVGNLTT